MKRIAILLLLIVLALVACGTPTPAPPSPPTPGSPFSLAGTRWSLVQLTLDGVTQTPNGVLIPTLEFMADGQLGGTGGCNSFGGNYTAQGEILSIQEIRSTLMACSPNEVMTLEAAYLAALEGARLFEKTDDQLTITFAEGRGRLLFQRQ